MQKLRQLADLPDLKGKTVLVRSDLDVPMTNGQIDSDFRIRKAVATIKYLIEHKAKVVIVAHLGRPDGAQSDDLSLLPVRFELGKLLGTHIKFAHIPNSRNSIRYMEDGEVLLLENVRFNPEEDSKDKKMRKAFVETLSELADYYVNDAFASYHPSASTYDLALAFDKPTAGLQMVAEVQKLGKLTDEPEKPYVAVIGGAKLDSKVPILEALTKQADYILIGGAMAYTFLAAQDVKIGDSKVEKELIPTAKKILEAAKKHKCQILLPVDHIAGSEFDASTTPVEVDTQVIPKGLIGLDIGQRTLASYLEIIKSARTLMWNGPMGVFEWDKFARGTEAVGEYIALSAPTDSYKVAGGGDTVSAIEKLQINMKEFDHISTGGGAMLALLAGEKMPTISVLEAK
jgi:phosphoglycerate kinase